MVRPLAAALLLLIGPAASAEDFTGIIRDSSLRRSVELVYIEKAPGTFAPAKSAPVINQVNNTYLPKLLPVVQGQKVVFMSEDRELHNVYARAGVKTMFNQAQMAKQVFEKTFKDLGPVHLTCNIHKEMSAWVLVLQNPFFAVPDAKTGAFTLPRVPPGKYVVRLWGEKMEDEDREKTFTITVGPGQEQLIVSSR